MIWFWLFIFGSLKSKGKFVAWNLCALSRRWVKNYLGSVSVDNEESDELCY